MPTKDLDEAYEKLKKNGQATVENIVKWMKDAHVLEKAQKTEEQAATMFSEVQDKSAVIKEKFMEVVYQMATSAKITHEAMCKQMVETGGRLMDAVVAAGTAFSATMTASAPDSSKK